MLNAESLLVVVLVGMCKCYATRDIDLGHEVNENSMYWLTNKPYSREALAYGYTKDGFW